MGLHRSGCLSPRQERRRGTAGSLTGVSHAELLEAIWESVPPGTEPERFALRRDWLLQRVRPGDRVLDVGCGEGWFTSVLADHGAHAVGIDVVAEPLERGRARDPRLDLRHAPLDAPLGVDDGSFDVVWAGELIEHLVDVVGWLADVRRVLPSGGRILVTTPDHPARLIRALAEDPEAFDDHFDPRSDHLRFFTSRTLAALMDDLNFTPATIASDGETLFLEAVRARF
jgi:2-polyprenyl-3-methyl-5-hydroxy-6-metoxy-1,4-benzoquinol methylase